MRGLSKLLLEIYRGRIGPAMGGATPGQEQPWVTHFMTRSTTQGPHGSMRASR
jgi:hypothetical protein